MTVVSSHQQRTENVKNLIKGFHIFFRVPQLKSLIKHIKSFWMEIPSHALGVTQDYALWEKKNPKHPDNKWTSICSLQIQVSVPKRLHVWAKDRLLTCAWAVRRIRLCTQEPGATRTDRCPPAGGVAEFWTALAWSLCAGLELADGTGWGGHQCVQLWTPSTST